MNYEDGTVGFLIEQQTWVLKQPIEAEYRPIDEDCDYERMFVEAFGEAISLDKFNNLFQPLDVSGLTRQVEELTNIHFYKDLDPKYRVYEYTEMGLSGLCILEYKPDNEQLLAGTKEQCFEQWMSFSEPYIDKKKTEIKEFAEQIVLLLLNQEKETK